MKIVDFRKEFLSEASELAATNYSEQRQFTPLLPVNAEIYPLDEFTENNMGTAAFEDGKMLGFLCACEPYNGYTVNTMGTFSPLHAHAAVSNNRSMIYKRLYQAAAEKWVNRGVFHHAISLYTDDSEALRTFFTYGFGLRCVDAIKNIERHEPDCCEGISLYELNASDIKLLLPLKNALSVHLGSSPMFMRFPAMTEEDVLSVQKRRNSRFFCASDSGKIIAFLEICDSGENFVCDSPFMRNICGAYCLPEYRGTGLYRSLLYFTENTLADEKFTLLGVDFESFNPTAYGFWLKYFSAYTNSVVRRADDRIN